MSLNLVDSPQIPSNAASFKLIRPRQKFKVGYHLILSALEKALSNYFSRKNYRTEFQDHPERAGSLSRLLNPVAFAQLQEQLGPGAVEELNNLCCESNPTLLREQLFSLVVDWEGGANHTLALQFYQSLAEGEDDIAKQAAHFFSVANGDGNFHERLTYNLRHVGQGTNAATAAGLMTGMTVGSLLRFGGLSLLKNSSGLFSASRMGGQFLVRGFALGGESLAVVAADQGIRQHKMNIPQDWSADHLWETSLHLAGRLLFIKAATQLSVGGAQLLGRVSPHYRLLTQRLAHPLGMTGGIYLGPQADFFFKGTYQAGEGHSLMDAVFGAAEFAVAGSLSHLLTPRSLSTALQHWNQRSIIMMKGYYRTHKNRLAVWWKNGTKPAPELAVQTAGQSSWEKGIPQIKSARPPGSPWAAQMSQTIEPRALNTLQKPTEGLIYGDRRHPLNRRYLLEYSGRHPLKNGNINFDHWELRIKPYANEVQRFHLPKKLDLEGPQGPYSFVKQQVRVEFKKNGSEIEIKCDELSQGPIKVFREGGIIKTVERKERLAIELGDVLAFPEQRLAIKIGRLTPEELNVPKKARQLIEQSDPKRAGLSEEEVIKSFAVGSNFLPGLVNFKVGIIENTPPLFLAFQLRGTRKTPRVELIAYRKLNDNYDFVHHPLVDAKGNFLGPQALSLSRGENEIIFRPLGRDGTLHQKQILLTVQITPLEGLKQEPLALAIRLGEFHAEMAQEARASHARPILHHAQSNQRADPSWLNKNIITKKSLRVPDDSELDLPDHTFVPGIHQSKQIIDSFFKNFRIESPSEFVIRRVNGQLRASAKINPQRSVLTPNSRDWPRVSLVIDLAAFRKVLPSQGRDRVRFSFLFGNLKTNTITVEDHTFELITQEGPLGKELRISLNAVEPKVLSVLETSHAFEALFRELGF